MSEPVKQSLYARFARLKAIREVEERRKQTIPQPPETDEYSVQPWRNQGETDKWIDQQYVYTRQYVAEYEVDQRTKKQQEPTIVEESSNSSDPDNKQDNEDGTNMSQNGTNISSATDDRGVFSRLRSLRGMRRPARSISTMSDRDSTVSVTPLIRAPPSTCADFERTSTIMPPTEMTSGEFQSNVDINELRTQYFSKYRSNQGLAIYKQRDTIIKAINSYSVVIIEGATGCGKTTQVPMYILEDAVMNRTSERSPVIYVTQPRRIAARSIADRICSEHGWNLGTLVGYQVSLEKVVGPQTVLVFCTAGVLLQKIIQEKSLKNYTHIIIDEAHERDADTDLLMMMIRKLMLQEMSLFRLIVMSATMDIGKLQKYFTFKTKYGHQSLITPSYIPATDQRLPTNIQIFYMNKLRQAFKMEEETPHFDITEPDLKDECLSAAVEIIVDIIPNMDNYGKDELISTLVFLPGLAEISRLDRKLREYPRADDTLDIIPLHSCLTVADQLKVFKSRPGCRKVILATNIAESSITISDVGFIVDFCLTKTLMKDNLTRFPTLKLMWATKDKCTQRAGRTGRCGPGGKVFRMVTDKFYQSFQPYAEPELLTAPLELSALRVKNFGMGDIAALLAVVLDPPPYNEIRTAVLELKQIGALAATYKGQLSDIDGDLTELGRVISALPIDVRLSKLIVVASVFDVLEDAIIVAACLSTNRTVVRYRYGGEEVHLNTYSTRLEWAKGTDSDLFVSLDCYYKFKELKEDRGKGDSWLQDWCERNYLDERKLHDVHAMVLEIKERLTGVNIFTPKMERPNMVRDPNMDYLMLKVAFCAAFYPNYFLTEKLDAQRIQKELGGLDPTRTVIMHNLPTNSVPLYKNQVVLQLENVCNDIEYIADCSRALLILKDRERVCYDGAYMMAEALDESRYKVLEQSREIPKAMFMALKLADNIGIDPFDVREYHDRAAMERMEYYNEQREVMRARVGPRLVPSKLKIVDKLTGNNQRLIDATDEEYVEITDRDYFIEVELNRDQDTQDCEALDDLERGEKHKKCDQSSDIFKEGRRRIRGPTSPIRMSFRSVLVKSKGFSVEIDHQSVNSILLDPEYEKDRRQMLVAASVTQTVKGKVMARDTTLMPNIRGVPSLFALLFAQYYRLIYNDKMNCIAGGIFGIGWDAADNPIDRSYEVILGFDVHITPDDMALINKARYTISELLKFTEIINSGKPQAIMQDELRKIILTLLRRRRFPLQELDVSMIYYQSSEPNDDNLFIKDIHNLPNDIIEEGKTRPFLPLAEFTREYQELAMYAHVRDNLDLLQRIDGGESMTPGGVRCLLCGHGVTCRFTLCGNLSTHLRSAEHLAKVKEFEAFERRALQKQAALEQQE